jgi:hypothetical protein
MSPRNRITAHEGAHRWSVWIEHLRGSRTRETEIFDRLLASLDPELGLYDGAAPPIF